MLKEGRVPSTVLSGPRIVSVEEGEIKTQIADHRSAQNLLFTLRERMHNVLSKPDPEMMKSFSDFVDANLMPRLRVFLQNIEDKFFDDRDIISILATKDYPKKKYDRYLQEN